MIEPMEGEMKTMSWSRYHSLSLSFAHMLARVRRNQKRKRMAARAAVASRRPQRKPVK
jgi:hypothetical protein